MAEYYVKNGGNDSASGADDTNAWAYHPWMSTWTGSTVLAAGDTVYMKRGDTWSIDNPVAPYMTVTQSGSEGSYITTTAYGSGEKPIIKIATASNYPVIYADAKSYLKFDNLHIQHHSATYDANDRNGIEMSGVTNPCHDIVITNCEISNIPRHAIMFYCDCYNITIGDTLSTETATTTNYSNHIHDFGYGGIILEGVNPVDEISNNKVYYNYIHDATRDTPGENCYGISFTAIVTSTAWPKYCYAKYNNVQNIILWVGISCHGGSYIYYQNNYVKNCGLGGLHMNCVDIGALISIGDHMYIENNIIEQPSSGWITGAEQGFIGVTNEASVTPLTNCFVRNNIIRFAERPEDTDFCGIYIRIFNDEITDLTISDNQIYNGGTTSSGQGIWFYPDGTGYSDIIISNNYINNWNSIGIDLRGGYIIGSFDIYNNIINSGSDAAYTFGIFWANLTASAVVNLYNNVLISESAQHMIYIYGGEVGSQLVFKNNIIAFLSAQNKEYYYFWNAIPAGFDADYNAYWNSSNATPFDGNDLADWQVLGYDVNTPNADETDDPLFVNVSTLYDLDGDFRLQEISPCINAGTDVGVTTDYANNTRQGNPDIGAFEYITSFGFDAGLIRFH